MGEEKLLERYETTRKAFESLKEAIGQYEALQHQEYRKNLRDSKIKRFEYCFDVLWKFLKISRARPTTA